MKITNICATEISLPFRFSFKHSLASRSVSENVIVAATIENDGARYTGYGESIPRDYVTGEDVSSALSAINSLYIPRFKDRSFQSAPELIDELRGQFESLQLDRKLQGASWCAFELALLDAAARASNLPLSDLIGGEREEHAAGITYGGVIPFGGKKAFAAICWFYKFFGFKTVKIKVGRDFDGDVQRLALARRVLGPHVTLRVDANCAWTAEETLERAQTFRQFGIASYEQPVAADDLQGLARITREIPEQVLADESLCSIEQAKTLAADRICSAFNIRISKVGGILAAREISRIAQQADIARHLGAQVGESGILSGAGRCFASTERRFDNCEGSNNFFLLKTDITRENLNVSFGGIGKLMRGPGSGVTVLPERLRLCEKASSPLTQASPTPSTP